MVTNNDPTVRARVAQALVDAFPPIKDLIDESLNAITAGAALTSILGVVGLVWTVSQLYGALDLAFARIFSGRSENATSSAGRRVASSSWASS